MASKQTTRVPADMMARRQRGGYDAASTVAAFHDIIGRHDGDNLASALMYQWFATERRAYAYVQDGR